MNNCTFIGKFVHDPLLTIQNNTTSTNFKLAVTHRFTKGNKEQASHTAFLEFEIFDSGARVLCSRFHKGNMILVETMAKTYRNDGKIHTVFRVEHFETLSGE